MEGTPQMPGGKRETALSDKELVFSQLQHNLDGDALARWMGMQVAGTPAESFVKWVDDFNATSAEDRGKGKYDHSRPLTENKDIELSVTSPSGHPYTITLHADGEVTLATSLSH